ncbi:hypothetical protein EDC01DRAFT_762321 [Geopyxis carbonaria]|nr:hypothetical protein EDC01DRAFT_762321 [Geopyxis carbonaria]
MAPSVPSFINRVFGSRGLASVLAHAGPQSVAGIALSPVDANLSRFHCCPGRRRGGEENVRGANHRRIETEWLQATWTLRALIVEGFQWPEYYGAAEARDPCIQYGRCHRDFARSELWSGEIRVFPLSLGCVYTQSLGSGSENKSVTSAARTILVKYVDGDVEK